MLFPLHKNIYLEKLSIHKNELLQITEIYEKDDYGSSVRNLDNIFNNLNNPNIEFPDSIQEILDDITKIKNQLILIKKNISNIRNIEIFSDEEIQKYIEPLSLLIEELNKTVSTTTKELIKKADGNRKRKIEKSDIQNQLQENKKIEDLKQSRMTRQKKRIEDRIKNIITKDNTFLTNLSKDIEETNDSIKELDTILKDNVDIESKEKDAFEKELKEFRDQIERQLQSAEKYQNETNKIKNAIEHLKKPAPALDEIKTKSIRRKVLFEIFSNTSFIFSFLLFLFFIIFIYRDFFYIYNTLKVISLPMYAFAIFPIAFTSVMGFLFARQANIKNNEITEINKRYILIHEVNQSLMALVEVYQNKNMDDKTVIIIDKLIQNILDYANGKTEKTSVDNEGILNLNQKLNDVVDNMNKQKATLETLVGQ